jgi:hypothetical protein
MRRRCWRCFGRINLHIGVSSSSRATTAPATTAPAQTPIPVLTVESTSAESGYRVDGPLVIAPKCMRSPEQGNCDGGDALLEGVLRIQDGCAFVDGGVELSYYTVVWAFGTAWDDATSEVVTVDGQRLASGGFVSLGGGESSVANMSVLYPGIEPPAQLNECASRGGVVGFWNSGY